MQVIKRLDALTTLRFFASAMIVIGHADALFGSNGIANMIPLEQGVSFFFVLSGFILTWNYPTLNGMGEVRKFLISRFARIYPLHLLTLFLWVALICDFDNEKYYPGFEGIIKLILNLFLLQVWVPLHDWALSFNGVSWSIATELFFYAMFPFLIRLFCKKKWHFIFYIEIIFIFLVIVLTTIYSTPSGDDYKGVGLLNLIYMNPLVRIFEFSAGMALAFFVLNISVSNFSLNKLQWFLIELISILVLTISLIAAANFAGIAKTLGDHASYYLGKEGLCLVWILLIGVFSLSHGPIKKLLSCKFGIFLGEISFALYLSHALIIHYLESYYFQFQYFGLLRSYLFFWIFCLSFAAILFIGIETPFRKFILAIYSKKEITTTLRSTFRLKEISAISLLLGILFVMYFYKPSTIFRLNQTKVHEFISPSSENIDIPVGIEFDHRYEIVAIKVLDNNNEETISVQVMLHTKIKTLATDTLALHLNTKAGDLIKSFDKQLDRSRLSTPADTSWIQTYKIPKKEFNNVASLGFAMYKRPEVLFKGTGGTRDWGGMRLIIPYVKSYN